MLNQRHFYHKGIRKAVAAFGSMFDGIQVVRLNSDGSEQSRERVPIAYGSKTRWDIRNTQDPELERKAAIRLPRMSYEHTFFRYAPDRKLSTLNKVSSLNSGTTYNRQFAPVAYDIGFNLYVIAETRDDAQQIVEQILPYFGPDYAIKVNMVEEPDITLDVMFSLAGVDSDDNWDAGFQEDRRITWTLSFVCKWMFFGPVSTAKKINQSTVKLGFKDPDTILETYTTVPTDPPKTLDQIVEDDDYGYVTIHKDGDEVPTRDEINSIIL